MTMRIVDVCAFYAPQGGGVKTYAEQKLRAARAYSQEVVIVAPGPDRTIIAQDGGSILMLPNPRFPFDTRYRYFADETALHSLLDELKPDVVEVSSPWGSPAMVARWRGPALRSLVMHADPLSAYAYRWLGGLLSREKIDRGFDWFWRHLRRLDDAFDLVISPSIGLGRRLAAGGLTKVTTVPLGVEPGLFSPQRRDDQLRAHLLRRCGLDDAATLLIGVGRLAPEKRWPMVIDAVAAAGYHRPVALVLFGDGRDRASVIRSAANNPHVLIGAPILNRLELATLLASADALVHGCEAETFCMVAAEAKASGLPLIVPDQGGAADQFVPGLGRCYRAASATALADAIRDFTLESRETQRSLAIAAAADVPDMNSHFAALFDLYASHVERAHAA